MTNRHIIQICHDYAGPFTRVCGGFVRAFPDDDVTTLFLKGEPSNEVEAAVGGEVLFLGRANENLRGFKAANLMRVAEVFKQRPADVVIAHRYKGIYAAGIMSYFFPVPVLVGVVHEHGVFKRLSRRLFVTLWRPQILLCGVSESVARSVAADCPGLERGKRLFVLGHPLPDREDNLLSRQIARAQLSLPVDALVIGSIGRLVHKKQYEVLLEAFAIMQQTEIQLVLIGDGPDRNKLEALVEQRGLKHRVKFCGHVENANRLIKALDVFVLCSGEQEAFGLVLLEAMQGKVPVVCSDAPGPLEVIGETGWKFRAGDPQQLAARLDEVVLLSAEARQKVGLAGFQRATTTFSEAAFQQALLALPGLAQENSASPGASS